MEYTDSSRAEIQKFIQENIHPRYTDFLCLISIDGYYQTDKYFFYECRMYRVKEMRLHKNSKRVSISEKLTRGIFK